MNLCVSILSSIAVFDHNDKYPSHHNKIHSRTVTTQLEPRNFQKEIYSLRLVRLGMVLSVLICAYENRAWIPAISLASQWIPYATISLVNGALYWVIPHKAYLWLDNRIYELFMQSCSFVFENANAAKINLYGDVNELRTRSDSAVVISNHQSDGKTTLQSTFISNSLFS